MSFDVDREIAAAACIIEYTNNTFSGSRTGIAVVH